MHGKIKFKIKEINIYVLIQNPNLYLVIKKINLF